MTNSKEAPEFLYIGESDADITIDLVNKVPTVVDNKMYIAFVDEAHAKRWVMEPNKRRVIWRIDAITLSKTLEGVVLLRERSE